MGLARYAHCTQRMLSLLRTWPLITDIKVNTLFVSREVTAPLCDRGMVSYCCQFENDLRKSPEAPGQKRATRWIVRT